MAHFCAAATGPSGRSAWSIIPPPGLAPGACKSAPDRSRPTPASSAGRPTSSHSAYRFSFVTVEYQWHPFHGRRLHVRSAKRRDGIVLLVEGDLHVSRKLPGWMCDPVGGRAKIEAGVARLEEAAVLDHLPPRIVAEWEAAAGNAGSSARHPVPHRVMHRRGGCVAEMCAGLQSLHAHECANGLPDSLGRCLDFLVPEVGVAQRHPHIAVTEQPGDDRDGHAVHHCVTRMSVAQVVKADILHACLPDGPDTKGRVRDRALGMGRAATETRKGSRLAVADPECAWLAY